MAGESIGCASRKKSKSKKDDKHGKNENNGNLSKVAQQSKTTRGGLRVYKIVILGDGGVGKSGIFPKKNILNDSILVQFFFRRTRNN